MRSPRSAWWEAPLCILVLAACLTGCWVSCKSVVRDLGCQVNGGDVVLKKWSAYNACTLDKPDAGR